MVDTSTEAVTKLLAGVTPGRAVQFHPRYCDEAKDAPFSDWDTSHHVSVIRDDGSRYRVAEFRHSSDAAFYQTARDLVPELLAERDALLRENENLRQIERNVQAAREHEYRRAEAALAEVQRLKSQPVTVQDAANVHEIRALIGSAEKVLHDIGELVANSEGVAGLHMNGEVADWDSLLPGGSFGAWLYSVDGLRAALRAIAEGRK